MFHRSLLTQKMIVLIKKKNCKYKLLSVQQSLPESEHVRKDWSILRQKKCLKKKL